MNLFRCFGRTPCTGNRPIARLLPTQNSTTKKNTDIIHISRVIRTHDPCVRAV